MKNILVVGATSGIAQAVCREYADKGNRLFLVARNEEKLKAIQSDLKIRGADKVSIYLMDIVKLSEHKKMLDNCLSELGSKIDIVLVAHGTLCDQAACERDASLTVKEVNVNATGTIALLTEIANILEGQKQGSVAVISSVAGDRGRASNYVYGSAKAAVSTFLEGLRVRLAKHNISVTDIKPGFVATEMTQDLDLPEVLTAEPEAVAEDIVKAIDKKKDILYTPFFWRYVMLVIKNIPNFIFKKLKL